VHGVIVHQHLYQPPREDPWLEVVRTEPSATPDHDWNARINRECYARQAQATTMRRDPRASARDTDARAGMGRVVNLYAWCSFDVGATLCEWLDSEAPDTLRAMQAGDAASVRRWGHGNAIAAPYHHVILPLASPRERTTEIRWGLRDFRRRFGREAQGFWLPECAADEDTLDAVAAEGVRFVILAPYQVHGHDGSGMPVRWRGAAGRTLTIVPYDGSLAGDVAFGGLLGDPAALARRFAPDIEATADRCTTLCTDGETFGHHHKGGDSALAEALGMVARLPGRRVLNAATLVAEYPPTTDVTLVSPSAWSCAHGVERWRSNCGCRLDGSKPPLQQWRGPLRHALEQLAERVHAVFAQEGATLFRDDVWAVRDAFGGVVAQDGDALDGFARAAVRADASEEEIVRARELLEMERASLRTFTSCAWFFDEVDRIEVRQVLRYAARCLELSGAGSALMPELTKALGDATSGVEGARTAADVFVREAVPHKGPALCTAAAVAALAAQGVSLSRLTTFDVQCTARDEAWEITLRHRRTGRAGAFTARVVGSGPSLTVSIAARDADAAAREVVAVWEFPEAAAVRLLGDAALSDEALLAPLG
jgi:alpha-amylase/alpha-mannosidase (GH57 family)